MDYLRKGSQIGHMINSEIVSKYSVLYVEDEKETRESAVRSLGRVGFANIYHAQNGLEGLAVFKEKRPEIVISDIQMPIMNGLDMVKEILNIADDTHVVLTTAFSDQEYFMRSIELRIDKYLMKPIDIGQLMDALYDACSQIEQKKLAFAYLAKESQERLNAAVNDAMKLVMDASPYPTVIFKKDKLSYINDAFLELLSHKDLEAIDRGILPSVFEQKSGYLGSLDEYKEGAHNKVCIKNSNGKDRIFELHKKEALLDGDTVGIYFLSDITLLEYQRRKLQLFGNAVQKELISKRFEQHKNADIDTKVSSTPIEKVAHRKIAALEYVSEIDHAIFEQMDELFELETELSDDIALFVEKRDGTYLRAFAERLEKYAYTMRLLFEFEELSFAIKNISEVLYQNSTNLSALNIDKIAIYCTSIADDLSGWRNGIFVTKSAIDIHYLDDSLYSSCLQLEFELKGIKLEDDGGELELF